MHEQTFRFHSIRAERELTLYKNKLLHSLVIRSFSYSSLSRLISTTNPESGTISYVYDGNGNLTQKTDARGTVTSLLYDPLNRLTQKNYTLGANTAATPNVTFGYGTGIGMTMFLSGGDVDMIGFHRRLIVYFYYRHPGRSRQDFCQKARPSGSQMLYQDESHSGINRQRLEHLGERFQAAG